MSDKLPGLGSDGTKIKDHIEGIYGGLNPMISTATGVFGDIASIAEDISKYSTRFLDLSAEEMKKISKQYLSAGIVDPKIKSKSDERRDEIAQRVFELNKDHYKFIKDSEKKKEKLERDKARSLKELGDGDSATRKLIEIQEKNPISRIFKTGMFDFRKGISDSIKSAPIFGEFETVKNIANRINPEMESEKDIERLIEVGKEIESLETAIKKAGGDHTEAGAKLAEELKSLKTDESEILGRTGDPLKEASDLNQIEFDKLQAELVSQNNILEEMLEALKTETDPALIKVLEDNRDSAERNAKELQKSIEENKDKQQSQTAEQEARIAAAKARAAGSPATSPIKAAKVKPTEKEDSSMFSLNYWFGKEGIFGKNKKVRKARVFFKRTLPIAMGGMLTSMTTIISSMVASIGTAFASLASALSAMLLPFLPAIAIAAGIALIVYSIKEAFDEMFEVFDSTGSIVETLKAGISRFVGTMLGLPLDLLKGMISYVAEWMGFEDFSKWLDSFSFADIITEFYVKFLDYIELAILGVNDFIENLFGVDILGALGDFFNLFNWDVIMADLKSYWESFKSKFSNIGEDLTSWFSESWQSFKTTFSELWGGLSSWVSEKWEGLKTTLGEKWEEIKEKFGLDPIITSIVDKVKSIFNMIIDKISSIGSSVLSFLAPIGIPKMELIGKSSWFDGLSVGPWYPFKDGGEEGAPQVPEAEPKPKLEKTPDSAKTPVQLLKEATDSGLFIDGYMSNSIDQSKLKGASTQQLNAILSKGQGVFGMGGLDAESLKVLTAELDSRKISEFQQLKNSEQIQKDSKNKMMSSGQGSGNYQQTNVSTGPKTNITTINKTLQDQPLGRKRVAID